jgi:hypothetical protein
MRDATLNRKSERIPRDLLHCKYLISQWRHTNHESIHGIVHGMACFFPLRCLQPLSFQAKF